MPVHVVVRTWHLPRFDLARGLSVEKHVGTASAFSVPADDDRASATEGQRDLRARARGGLHATASGRSIIPAGTPLPRPMRRIESCGRWIHLPLLECGCCRFLK